MTCSDFFARWTWTCLFVSVFCGIDRSFAGAATSQQQTSNVTAPAIKQTSIDQMLTRPYDADVPMGCVGARMWASSPQGWAFRDDVHWLYLSNLHAFDVEVRDGKGLILPSQGTYYPSHVHMFRPVRAEVASASFTYGGDNVLSPLSKPFVPHKRWTCWSSGKRDDWYALDFPVSRQIQGLKVHFFSDAPRGFCREPESVTVQIRKGTEWKPVTLKSQSPTKPAKGENTLLWDSLAAEGVRLSFKNLGKEFYTGIYGFEVLSNEPAATVEQVAVPVNVECDKFITEEDVLVSVVTMQNPTAEKQSLTVTIASPLHWPTANVDFGALQSGENSYSLDMKNAVSKIHGFNVHHHLFATIDKSPVIVVTQQHGQQHINVELAPGAKSTLQVAMAFADTAELAKSRALNRPIEPVENQVRAYQKWFDDNVAVFDCSDPLIKKMYYHRAYNLLKNSMDPKLGKMQWKAFTEGRWRSRWYSNVISYGAGHQIRESRWLRDKSYWQGHLQTFANNPKADGVFPSHVTPDGAKDSQYTDWISSTAWDGNLVHPDKKFLEEIADKLAVNVRGWQKVYDPDGDGLLLVDSHWWTGMEWQPSFFAFCNYKTSSKDRLNPKTIAKLDRVDLTAYQFGNAINLAKVYREINKPEKAKEFDDLAEKIRKACLKKMWDGEEKFFYSLRHGDGAKADVKEVIGVYPFYFGLVPAKSGYEKTWESILDPEQFWTTWPLASSTKKNIAYSQDGWPTDKGGTGCMWNGPTWPHANSIVMSGMARSIRESRMLAAETPLTREHLWDLFVSFTKAQYRDQDPNFPWTGEFYHGETGKWKTGERDYNHSTWLDILIPDLLGLNPRNDDTLKLDPLIPAGKLHYFVLADQIYHGHNITLIWDSPDDTEDHYNDGRKGFDLYIDGKLAASAATVSPLNVKLP